MVWKVVNKKVVEDDLGKKHEVWYLQNGPKKKAIVSLKEGSIIYYIFTNFGPISPRTQDRIIEVVEEYEKKKQKEKGMEKQLFKKRTALRREGNRTFLGGALELPTIDNLTTAEQKQTKENGGSE